MTSLTSESGTIGNYFYRDPESGETVETTAKQLTTNAAAPSFKVTTNVPATVEAFIGDTCIATAENGVLALNTLTVDGDYAVELRVTNRSTGDVSVSVVYVTIDTLEPAIFITSPEVRTKTATEYVYDDGGNAIGVRETPASESPAVDFRVPVKVEGMTEAGSRVKANGTALTVDENGKFSGNVNLPSTVTKSTIKIVATDKAGNVNTAKMTVTNKSFNSPIGLSVLRTGTMQVGETGQAELYLRYPDKKIEDGRNEDGSTRYRQNYRSEKVTAEQMSRITFKIEKGDAVSITEDGQITALRSGASLVSATYKVSDSEDSAVLSSTVALLVADATEPGGNTDPTHDPDPNPNPGEGGGTSGGGTSGGGAGGGGAIGGGGISVPIVPDAGEKTDVVINGASGKSAVTEGNTVTVAVTEADQVNTAGTLEVKLIGSETKEYTLDVAAGVAKGLAGENGAGVKFASGAAEVNLSGNALTGQKLTVSTVKTPATDAASAAALKAMNVTKAFDGVQIKLTGTQIDLADRASVRIQVPAGVKASDVTGVLYVDENGNYTNLPAKLTVAGSTAYISAALPGSGVIIPVKGECIFTDVKPDFWGYDAITKAAGSLLVRGKGNGIFEPKGNATRAEFSAIILRAGGASLAKKGAASYKDVSKNDWYYDTVSVASALGILNGYNGYAYPNRKVSRVEGMALACRMLKLKGVIADMSAAEAEKILSAYADASQVPAWARIEVAMCIQSGVIVGSNGKILPNADLSRAEAAVIAIRISEAITKAM